MYAAKRPPLRPVILVFILFSWVLVACGARLNNDSWPGLTTDGQKIYIAYGPGVLAYDAATQDLVWQFAPEPGRVSFFAAPSVTEERIVVGDYGAQGGFFSPGVTVSIYGLPNPNEAVANLSPLWQDSELAEDRIVAPALQVGDRAYVGTADNKLLALDADTGAKLWEFNTGHSIWGRPSYKDGVIYVTSLDRSVYALDAEKGTLIWQTTLEGAVASEPVVNDGLLYITSFDQKLHALSLETGEEVWSAAASDWIWGAPVLVDGVVYFAGAQGNVFALDARSGEQLWSNQVDGTVQTSPLVHEGIVYIASDVVSGEDEEEIQGLLTALSAAENGRTLWEKTTPAPIYTTPVVVGDSVIVALQSETDLLRALDRESGAQQWLVPKPEL